MKKIIILIAMSSLALTSFSQEKTKEKDLSANLYNLQSFGLQYKVGDGTSMWRYRIVNAGISIGTSTNENPNISVENRSTDIVDFDLGFSVGREKRKDLGANFQFVYGLELITRYSFYEQKNNRNSYKYQLFGTGIGGVFGIKYELNNKLFVGFELLPSVVVNFDSYFSPGGSNEPFQLDRIDAGFGRNSALISLGFTF